MYQPRHELPRHRRTQPRPGLAKEQGFVAIALTGVSLSLAAGDLALRQLGSPDQIMTQAGTGEKIVLGIAALSLLAASAIGVSASKNEAQQSENN